MKPFLLFLLSMKTLLASSFNSKTVPKPISSVLKNNIRDVAKVSTALGVQLGAISAASAANFGSATDIGPQNNVPDTLDRFTTIGNNLPVCRLLNGMWQVSGAHGFEPDKDRAVSDMARYAGEGFTTFDLADIYGPAEEFVGAFRKGPLASSTAKGCQFFTKWVPRPQEVTRAITSAAIERSLSRMRVDAIDLLQFHWWDYDNKYYFDAMAHLMDQQQRDRILNLGLTNFDTEHMVGLINEDVPIVSNQVSYSILDTRPAQLMAAACREKNVKLLCYGSLLGGFLSSAWKGKSEPSLSSLTNVSLRKYLPWINYWGGWQLFQELLTVLDVIAIKHDASISNVALRWVIDQPAVGGAIVGARLGYRQHIEDNKKVFSIRLDEEDIDMIQRVQKKSNDLMNVFGDCGGEYRARRRPNPRA